MSIMNKAFRQSNNRLVAGHVAQIRAKEEAERKRKARQHARELRDQAIMLIHQLSYSRKSKRGGGKLVPRRKENRAKLADAMRNAQVYAYLARPEHGYPRPPYVRDPEYPPVPETQKGMDMNHVVAERNRLTFWLSVLEQRNADVDVRKRVYLHIQRLQRKVERMQLNNNIRRRPGSKEYNLRPAPTAHVQSRMPIVQFVRSLSR